MLKQAGAWQGSDDVQASPQKSQLMAVPRAMH
jgi:hypothetical protein